MQVSSIVVVGCNHVSAPLSLLERLSIPANDLDSALARLQGAVRDGFILSTCNRTELYATAGQATSGAERLIEILAERAGTDASELRPHVYVHTGAAAVNHALRVASGLDSMVLGEDQIQAQWKRALTHARSRAALGPILDRLGDAALACGKRVRTFTGIGQHAVSLESLAVREVARRLGPLDERHLLVIGAGESAALIIKLLHAAGGAEIVVVSRAISRVEEFARAVNARAAPIDALPDFLVETDAVFSCTSAPHPVLGAAHFAERSARRPDAPALCMDLGMPRDVDASAESVAGVQVVRLDELASLADAHRAARRQHVPAAEAIVAAEATRYMEWQARRAVNKLLHAPAELLTRRHEAESIALAFDSTEEAS